MAFERLDVRAASGKRGMPASMSLSCHGGSSRPAAIVAIGAALALEAGFTAASRFSILFGTEEDAGRLRVHAEANGVIAARALKGGGLLLNLGYVPVLGVEPCKKKPTEAKLVAPDIIELEIPDFREGRQKLLPPPAVSRTESPPPKATTPLAKPEPVTPPPSAKGETYHGITISFKEDDESVSFRGKVIEVTTRQAVLVKLLARPMPQPVAESFLTKACWHPVPKDAPSVLRQMVDDLRSPLVTIGLDLRPVKGVGYQIKVA